MNDPASPAALTSTASMFYEVFTGNPMWSVLFKLGHNFVDVRDVAEGMVKALEIEEAGGQRFLMTSRTCALARICFSPRLMCAPLRVEWFTWQDYCEYISTTTTRSRW